MSNYLTFQRFENEVEANEIASILTEHNIETQVEKEKPILDQVIIGKQQLYYLLKIPADDFQKAQKVLIDNTKVDISEVDKDYMLFSLSDKELLDVIASPQDWGAYNYNLAKQILQQRGSAVTDDKAKELQQQHIYELERRRDFDSTWLFLGYFFSFATIVSAFVGHAPTFSLLFAIEGLPGILGIIIGWTVLGSKITLPDGRQVTSYTPKARKHARNMLLLGILGILLNITVFIIRINTRAF
jgi:hypothetical protein